MKSSYFLQYETVDTSAGEPIGYQDGFLSSYRTFRQRSATKVVEEGKAYITCDVSALNNACYNTHCNMNGTTQADCKLDVAIDTVVTIGEHDYRIFSDPTTSDKTRIYGNLGLIVGPAGTLSPETTEAAAE